MELNRFNPKSSKMVDKLSEKILKLCENIKSHKS